MTPPNLEERRLILQLQMERARRRALSGLLHSPLMRWRYGGPTADELLLVPQELRTADASFAREVEQGLFGLGGIVATIGNKSVFDVNPPNDHWERNLHGFSWLRHLGATNDQAAAVFARTTVREWITRHRRRTGIAWMPDVVGRRMYSLLANSEFLLRDADHSFYDSFTDSLGRQLIHLCAHWRETPSDDRRVTALIGLMISVLCIAGHERLVGPAADDLARELSGQLNQDGGHKSRNPGIVVELLMDLLPLKTCFQARDLELPPAIADGIEKMLRFLQYMRLGDGSLARFNGVGVQPFDALARLSAYIADGSQPLQAAGDTGYARLARGGAVVLMDAGKPPPIALGAAAAAGCLSFEFSAGPDPVLVNGGAPGPADREWLSQSRASASHNTLVLGARSSSKMLQSRALEHLTGGYPLRFPDQVSFDVYGDKDALAVKAEHDGYRAEFGLIHRRVLRLAKDGSWLEGRDEIASAGRQMRLPRDIPFSIHFHLAPSVEPMPQAAPDKLEFKLPGGAIWEFTAPDATLSVEDSIHYADHFGPARSHQIVLRGTCFGDKTINWRFARIH